MSYIAAGFCGPNVCYTYPEIISEQTDLASMLYDLMEYSINTENLVIPDYCVLLDSDKNISKEEWQNLSEAILNPEQHDWIHKPIILMLTDFRTFMKSYKLLDQKDLQTALSIKAEKILYKLLENEIQDLKIILENMISFSDTENIEEENDN